jgi:hypothetical protein
LASGGFLCDWTSLQAFLDGDVDIDEYITSSHGINY